MLKFENKGPPPHTLSCAASASTSDSTGSVISDAAKGLMQDAMDVSRDNVVTI
jgi:hypothetical protein